MGGGTHTVPTAPKIQLIHIFFRAPNLLLTLYPSPMPFLLLHFLALLVSITHTTALSLRHFEQDIDFSSLPSCVSDHATFASAAADFNCAGPISRACICGSSGPFPWGSSCSPDDRYFNSLPPHLYYTKLTHPSSSYTIEQWYAPPLPPPPPCRSSHS